jgi:hypothetical protein
MACEACYRNTQICLMARLDVGLTTSVPSALWEWLLHVVERHDAILTTNYDTLIELAGAHLWEQALIGPHPMAPGRDYGWIDFGVNVSPMIGEDAGWPRDFVRIKLLKLHGSTSWKYCAGCPGYRLDSIYRYGAIDGLANDAPCRRCGQRKWRPVLVPPLARKRYEDEPAIAEIRSTAQSVLSQATEIVFAGFSLDPTDEGIRDLLRQSFDPRVTRRVQLVDPRAGELIPRYEDIYGSRVETHAVAWADFVETYLATSPGS